MSPFSRITQKNIGLLVKISHKTCAAVRTKPKMKVEPILKDWRFDTRKPDPPIENFTIVSEIEPEQGWAWGSFWE